MTTPTKVTMHPARKTYLHMMFTTACEGGIQYWASFESYRWSVRREYAKDERVEEDIDGFKAVIRSSEGEWGIFNEDDNRALTIDLEVMELGCKRFLQYCHGMINSKGEALPAEEWTPLPPDHYWRQWLVQEATNGAEGDSDVEVADQIVQWGLFNEGVYG